MVHSITNSDTSEHETPVSQSAHAEQSNIHRKRGPGRVQVRAQVPCKFYAKGDCKAGESCPFLHDPSRRAFSQKGQNIDTEGALESVAEQPPDVQIRQYQAPAVSSSKIVSKPIPKSQQEDPRKFQIEQLKRRFSSSEINLGHGTTLSFRLVPSDPDFPFDLDSGLQCVLFVPASYPKDEPSLKVTNKEMGRGFQINVETGFANLARRLRTSTLLGLVNNLDRQLETILTGKEAETIKIIRNSAAKQEPLPELEQPPPSPQPEPRVILFSGPQFTAQQLSDAENKRKVEMRQLEARLGRQPRFERSADGLTFMLPIVPRRRQDLPVPLQNVNTVELTVPRLYPLELCTIRLFGTQPATAENTELAFLQYIQKQVQAGKPGNLLGYVNYLASNMHLLATTQIKKVEPVADEMQKLDLDDAGLGDANIVHNEQGQKETVDEERPHVIHVQRPPEWDAQFEHSGESDTDYSDTDDDFESETWDDDNPNAQEDLATGPERGIMLSLPHLELHGIEVLEIVSLAVSLRCTRCKDTLDVEKLRHEASKLETCKKCGQGFGIGFRRELMHTNSVRAGYLDLDGCTVVDLLPSHFIPTCAECSTPQAAPGVVSVRGQSSMAICRHCHHKMSFIIPEVKFLQVSASASTKNRPPPRRKVRESLGITAGTELPNRGRCEHYRKSYRWFRFSCCQKVFACDKCHDNVSDHLTEFANRMLCGWCSREQLYRPETCAFCRNNVIGKRGGGFWEGGKGTRDKNLMSRKDPRKFKRRTGVNAKVGGSGKK